MIYAYYIAENGLSFLTDVPIATFALRILCIGIIVVGALAPDVGSILFFLDPFLGLMAIINLVVIAMLFPRVLRLLKDFQAQLSAGKCEPEFLATNFQDLEIDPEAWGSLRPR